MSELDLDAIEAAYRPLPIGESSDSWEIDATYHVLVGPDFSCTLTEPEDRTWCRDGADAVKRLNEQHRRIREQDATIAELRALCGEADEWMSEVDYGGDYLEERDRLRAASKGEQ